MLRRILFLRKDLHSTPRMLASIGIAPRINHFQFNSLKAKRELANFSTRFNNEYLLIERGQRKMFSTSTSFKTHLQSLSSKELLSHYGDWSQTTEQRRMLSLTGVDEYMAIRQSLYVMAIFLKYDSLEDIAKALQASYSEDDFIFTGIKVESKDEKAFLENIGNIVKLRNTFRDKYPNNTNELLIETFILHDLGKQKSFVSADAKSAASNEKYLKDWLEQKANAARKERYENAGKLIDIFDGLGYNPTKLLSSGYTGVLTPVENSLEYLSQLNKTSDNTAENNTEALNNYLFQKAKALGLNAQFNFEFLVDSLNKRKSWSQLTNEEQNKVVMLLLCCPFIFVKPPLNTQKVTEEFVASWNNTKNQKIVDELCQFFINNIFSKDPMWLYNITGLLHHTSAQGGSHFANGGTVEELFSVFFPFLLNSANGKMSTIPVEAATERTFNKFQMLQGLEMVLFMPQSLLKNKGLALRAINYTAPAVKSSYLECLQKAKSENLQKKSVVDEVKIEPAKPVKQQLDATEHNVKQAVKSQISHNWKRIAMGAGVFGLFALGYAVVSGSNSNLPRPKL